MRKFATTIRSAARWYARSCAYIDPAAALAMFGTGMVAVPVSLSASDAVR